MAKYAISFMADGDYYEFVATHHYPSRETFESGYTDDNIAMMRAEELIEEYKEMMNISVPTMYITIEYRIFFD